MLVMSCKTYGPKWSIVSKITESIVTTVGVERTANSILEILAMEQKEYIATIELDNKEGAGQLFWKDGGIYYRRVSDGEECPTGTGCSENQAVTVIAATWGDHRYDLQWTRLFREVVQGVLHDEGFKSPAFFKDKFLDRIGAFAPKSEPLIIYGESGTGKELMAKAIHEMSRKGRPFLALNCAGIPSTLIESELFGHLKGSFSGATTDKKGLMQEAGDGTIFLDEIGDMPLEMQTKLLRVLNNGKYRPIGNVKKEETLKARVICATNKTLPEEIQNNKFRFDLYQRFTYDIPLPTLQDEIRDASPNAFNVRLATFLLENTSSMAMLSREAIEKLESYSWPGNFRECDKVLKKALALCENNNPSGKAKLNFPDREPRSVDGVYTIIGADDLELDKETSLDDNQPSQKSNIDKVPLKDIVDYAQQQARELQANILKARIRSVYKSGRNPRSVIVLEERGEVSAYTNLTKVFQKCTGQKLTELKNKFAS